ncbi:MAG: DUF2095 family protein [Promethearchaeota archaeon]|nr:MAG: DUF2095 family protein [Candidatus Lokiarchaeota archaeon]
MGKKNNSKKNLKNFEVEESNGLKISYNKDELKKQFPHLVNEISSKRKMIQIDSYKMNIEQNSKQEISETTDKYPNELYNPKAIDFLRRCTKKKEAINILDYLLKRNEITQKEYNLYLNIISKEGGLKRLIDESGGLKRPGYYMRKYYKKPINDQKINSKKD